MRKSVDRWIEENVVVERVVVWKKSKHRRLGEDGFCIARAAVTSLLAWHENVRTGVGVVPCPAHVYSRLFLKIFVLHIFLLQADKAIKQLC